MAAKADRGVPVSSEQKTGWLRMGSIERSLPPQAGIAPLEFLKEKLPLVRSLPPFASLQS
ncbi:MAG: hypothetical protein V7L29_06140 [Nostoc sp.]|uniref:hypothetical protein n=1 Tax=Nostoc sp. TaxID=1180 RepID=UPI002FF02EE4